MNTVSWDAIQRAIKQNPTRSQPVLGGAATASISVLPAEGGGGAWLPGWTEDTVHVADALALSLWIREPLYRSAAQSIRRAMEKEEASALHLETGSIKGRKHIEEELRARAGGGPPLLDAWEQVRTVKRATAMLEFVCTVRAFAVCVWWPTEGTVSVYGPLSPTTSLIQFNGNSGRVLLGPSGEHGLPAADFPALLLTAPSIQWVPSAPIPSLTVKQLQEQIVSMGAQSQPGSRTTLWSRLQWLRFIEATKK